MAAIKCCIIFQKCGAPATPATSSTAVAPSTATGVLAMATNTYEATCKLQTRKKKQHNNNNNSKNTDNNNHGTCAHERIHIVHASMCQQASKNKKKNDKSQQQQQTVNKSNTTKYEISESVFFFNMQTVGQKFVSMQAASWLAAAHAHRTLKTQAHSVCLIYYAMELLRTICIQLGFCSYLYIFFWKCACACCWQFFHSVV